MEVLPRMMIKDTNSRISSTSSYMLDFENVCIIEDCASALFLVKEIIKCLKLITGDQLYLEANKICLEDTRSVM